jgi:hypothetical protein
MNVDLLRQRRNLIAISAILLIFDFAQVTITKISLLGTDLLVGNVQVLMICAWVLWAYSLLRYYQYWRAEEAQPIRLAYKKRLDTYVRAYTKAQAVQDSAGQMFNDYKIDRTGLASWTYTLQCYDPRHGSIKDGPSHPLPAWRLAGCSLRSIAHVCVHTHHATDHVLPFAMALAAPIVTLSTKWPWITQ